METLRTGIKQAISTVSPSEIKYLTSVNSPLRTPKRSDISPPTPSKEFIHTKLMELKSIKSQLENERFERNALELEVKQSQEKIENLVQKCKYLNHEVKLLKASSESPINDCENISPNKSQRISHLKRKMEREIEHREEVISSLKIEIENVNEMNQKYQQKIKNLEKQMNELRLKIRELDASNDDLECNMELKNKQIISLQEEVQELRDIIHEVRSTSSHPKNISSDFLDLSCSTSLYTTTNDFGETLAKSVIDVQLKEKENEISRLNDLLSYAEKEKNDMERIMTDLTATLKKVEAELSDTKTNTTKMFEEKSIEIQILQNQLNSAVSQNRDLQRDIELKQKINLQLQAEGDAAQLNLKDFQKEICDLKDQKTKYEEDICRLQDDLKDKINLQQQGENYRGALKEISSKIMSFDGYVQEQMKTLESKLKEKENKILNLQETSSKFESLLKESNEKVILKCTELDLLNTKYLELEKKQIEETKFNDQLAHDNDILRAKLVKERNEKVDLQTRHAKELEVAKQEKVKYFGDMDKKLGVAKAEMVSRCSNDFSVIFIILLITDLRNELIFLHFLVTSINFIWHGFLPFT